MDGSATMHEKNVWRTLRGLRSRLKKKSNLQLEQSGNDKTEAVKKKRDFTY